MTSTITAEEIKAIHKALDEALSSPPAYGEVNICLTFHDNKVRRLSTETRTNVQL